MQSMYETALDRFLKIRSYNDTDEVMRWLNDEAKRLDYSIPDRYADMLSLSMLSDLYYENVPENVLKEIEERTKGNGPTLLGMFNSYRIAEARMVAMANWSDITHDYPDADRVRKYIYSLIEDHHGSGFEVTVSSVSMEAGEADEYGILPVNAEDSYVDEFESDMLSLLCDIFMDFSQETALQIFFNKPRKKPKKAFILVNCLWFNAPDGYEDQNIGPFVIAGKGRGGIELIAPDNLGLKILPGKGL